MKPLLLTIALLLTPAAAHASTPPAASMRLVSTTATTTTPGDYTYAFTVQNQDAFAFVATSIRAFSNYAYENGVACPVFTKHLRQGGNGFAGTLCLQGAWIAPGATLTRRFTYHGWYALTTWGYDTYWLAS